MTLKKRLRILWAAMTQEWHLHTCHCGRTQWVEGRETWADPLQCVPCEIKQMNQWTEQYQARTKGVA